jgi:hypothetical protein
MSPLADLPNFRSNFLSPRGSVLGKLAISGRKSVKREPFFYYERDADWALWRSLIQELDL